MKTDNAKTYAKARRRKTGRTPTPVLFQLSENAYRLGKTATKIFATIRLSLSKRTLKGLAKAASLYKITLSSAARRLLSIADATEEGKRAEALKRLRYFTDKRITSKPKRKTKTKIDVWAESPNAPKLRACQCLRLTARELGEIAEYLENNRHKGIAKTFSKAFEMLLLMPLLYIERIIERKQSELDEEPTDEKPRRQNRNRAYTEAKRRIIERGCIADL